MSKGNADIIWEPLTDIINAIFAQRFYPNIWKMAEVIPIPKTKTPHQCKDFRPILLLYHYGKVAEKFFMREYKKQVLPSISNHQFVYQPGLSTTDAVIFTLEQWTALLDDKSTKAVEVIFKDFSKAFDPLQPSKLATVLADMGVSADILELSLHFMSSRQQCVRVKSSLSDYKPIDVGVPQGTLLGPMFWLAFINSYNPPSSHSITMYADDITCTGPLTESNSSHIQSAIDWGLEWCEQQSMTLNLDKTKATLITFGPNSKPPIIVSPIEVVDS